jgi:poly-gamma-glutamate synthesis protein (capsule biosynthesis protein)
VGLVVGLCVLGLASSAVAWGRLADHRAPVGASSTTADRVPDKATHGHAVDPAGPQGTVTLAFAGDMHFQLHLAALLDHPRGALGPIANTLADADLAMVNLESAIAEEGRTPEAKELEEPSERFYFRTSPAALDVLDAAGVDVVTMANNHGADYGPEGVADTLAAVRTSPVPVVGIGRDRRAAFTPYRVSVRGTDFAFLAADASMREGASNVWAAGATTSGIAAAHADRPRALVAAVRAASRQDDVVVVYMHWGEELQACPTHQQRTTAQALADAGADIIVGSHAHVLLGSGWLGDTYVDYGLGNFLWYHDHQPESGVLQLTIRDGHVIGDSWTPARIQTFGRPLPLQGRDRADAIADWRLLRGCTGLAAGPNNTKPPSYHWSSGRIGPVLQQRMRSSYHPGCPVPLTDLRYLQVTYVGFDGHAHIGELVVHRDYARQVANVFGRLYDAGWPIRRMRLVDDYGGDDNRSMAANNTSGYNCRWVAGSQTWSAHAYGAAIDINPVQNPDLSGPSVAPPAGGRFATTGRSGNVHPVRGLITADGPVVRAFSRIGWEWGGTWASGKDYQHFSASE